MGSKRSRRRSSDFAARPVAWADGKPLRETLLGLYRTEAAPGIEADVIYTFWVKHAICTDQSCKKEVPLFKDYLVAQKTMFLSAIGVTCRCPKCRETLDWETAAGYVNRRARADGKRAARRRR